MKYENISESLYIKGRIGWKGLKKGEYLKTGDYRIINGSNISNGVIDWSNCGYITKQRYFESPEIMLKKGDILITKDGTIGKVAIVNKLEYPSTIASGLFILRNNAPEKWNTLFLYYYLQTNRFKEFVHSRTEGSVIPHLYQKDFEKLEIPYISLTEQYKISSKLDLIQRKISLNSQINDNLLELMDNLFYNFFPQINVGDDLIGSFIQNYDRFRKPLSKEQRSAISGKYRYIGAASVMDYINKYNFDGIYLLLGEDGTVIDNKGYPILQYVFGKFWPNNHTHVLKGKNISTEWLYLFFRQRKVLNIVTGAVQKKISQKNLNSLKFSHPNKEDYLKFNEIIQPLFSDIRIRIKENKRLHQLKQELLKQYF